MSALLPGSTWKNVSSMTDTPLGLAGYFASLIGVLIVMVFMMVVMPKELSSPFWGFIHGTTNWAGAAQSAPVMARESAQVQQAKVKAEAVSEEPPRDPPRRDRWETVKV